MTRIFANFGEAINELRRDLSELSVSLSPTTWQGKSVEGNPNFTTKELQNYLYTVTDPDPMKGLNPTQPWADLELKERLSNQAVNPGDAYKARLNVWEEFLEVTDKFSYSYSERLTDQIWQIVRTLKAHTFSRQLFLSVWDMEIDPYALEKHRVPCSLGYYFQYRHGTLNMTYLQRSCDFVTHYDNDVYLSVRLLEWMAEKTGLKPGHFSHWIGSLHVLGKDVEGVF